MNLDKITEKLDRVDELATEALDMIEDNPGQPVTLSFEQAKALMTASYMAGVEDATVITARSLLPDGV